MACPSECDFLVKEEASNPRLIGASVNLGGCRLPAGWSATAKQQVIDENGGETPGVCSNPDCDCVLQLGAQPVLVAERTITRSTTLDSTTEDGTPCTWTITYNIDYKKWRTAGECVPKNQEVGFFDRPPVEEYAIAIASEPVGRPGKYSEEA